MKAKRITTLLIAVLMAAAMFTSAFSLTSAALTSRNGSITLHVISSSTGNPISGATFRLYHFANAYEASSGVRYEFISPYQNAGVALDNLQDSYLPIHLAHFAKVRALPYMSKNSDASGEIVFDDLTPGLYLIVPYANFDGHFTPTPFIINIPGYNSSESIWEYDIVATPKMIIIGGNLNTLTTYLSIQKKWETDQKLPDSITVVLLRDMEEYDEIKLSASNNWYYRWDNLTKDHVWSVVEMEVPDGYAVRYEASSNTVTIINKYEPEEETTDNPPPGDTTTRPVDLGTTRPGEDSSTNPGSSEDTTFPGGNTTRPGDGGGTTSDNTGETTDRDELIDTGQLNWPVPLMAIAGLLFFSTGWAMLNLGKKETE